MVHRKLRTGIHGTTSGVLRKPIVSTSDESRETARVQDHSEPLDASAALRLSLAWLILVALESCSSPPRSRTAGGAVPPGIAVARTEQDTPSLLVPPSALWAFARRDAPQVHTGEMPTRASAANVAPIRDRLIGTVPILEPRFRPNAPAKVAPHAPAQALRAAALPPRRPPDLGAVRGAAPADIAQAGSESAAPQPESIRIGLVGSDRRAPFVFIARDLEGTLIHDRIKVVLSDSGGPLKTLDRLLHDPSADVGIVQTDALERFVQDNPAADARRRLRSVARLYDEAVHVVARTSVKDLHQLDGRKVNVGVAASAREVTARLVFEKLGIRPVLTNGDVKDALDHLGSGEIDAVFVVAQRPALQILMFETAGFHLLPVPWDPALESLYEPAELNAAEYPTLLEKGEAVATVKVPVILAALDRIRGSVGAKRLERLTASLAGRLDDLRQPGRNFEWKAVDLSAPVPGWERLDAGPWRDPKPAPKEQRDPARPEGRP
jgi:TRAP-type uncharacterized transport system substrate-binding protein